MNSTLLVRTWLLSLILCLPPLVFGAWRMFHRRQWRLLAAIAAGLLGLAAFFFGPGLGGFGVFVLLMYSPPLAMFCGGVCGAALLPRSDFKRDLPSVAFSAVGFVSLALMLYVCWVMERWTISVF